MKDNSSFASGNSKSKQLTHGSEGKRAAALAKEMSEAKKTNGRKTVLPNSILGIVARKVAPKSKCRQGCIHAKELPDEPVLTGCTFYKKKQGVIKRCDHFEVVPSK